MFEKVQGGIGSEGAATPPGKVEQPGTPRIERKKGVRSTSIPRAKLPRDGAFVPLELVKLHLLGIAGRTNFRSTVREQNTFSFECCVVTGVPSTVEPGVCSNIPQDTNGWRGLG